MDPVCAANWLSCAAMLVVVWQLRRSIAVENQQFEKLDAEIEVLVRAAQNRKVAKPILESKRSSWDGLETRRRWQRRKRIRSKTISHQRRVVARMSRPELEEWSRLIENLALDSALTELAYAAESTLRRGHFDDGRNHVLYYFYDFEFVFTHAWAYIGSAMATHRLARVRRAPEVQARWDQRRMERATAPASGANRMGARL